MTDRDQLVSFARKDPLATSSRDMGGRGLFNGQITAMTSSLSLSWRGLVIEENVLAASEMREGVSDQYRVALWRSCGTGEHVVGRSGYLPFLKPPGTLTFIAPGLIPAARTKNLNHLICCSLKAAYVDAIEGELDRPPLTRATTRTGFSDPSISRLLELLTFEARTGGEAGRLYADQLAHALGTRILMLGREPSSRSSRRPSPLSKIALRRVLDRMHSSDGEIALASLAEESGYSRRHFLRMFRQSMGVTPHQYALEFKLQRAQAMMKETSRSLIDIALSCGFASHSHMSRVFRKQRGLSPSELRRAL